jgi:probable rRNA maturation factor
MEQFLKVYKKSNCEVSLAIVSDAKIKRLNQDYRGINKVTDVLSFPGLTGKYLGEIVINIQEARRPKKYQAMLEELGLDIKRLPTTDYIFYFLLVHGLLHLLGYDDQTDQARIVMLQRGQNFLQPVL